jgi:hypothetical protein
LCEIIGDPRSIDADFPSLPGFIVPPVAQNPDSPITPVQQEPEYLLINLTMSILKQLKASFEAMFTKGKSRDEQKELPNLYGSVGGKLC